MLKNTLTMHGTMNVKLRKKKQCGAFVQPFFSGNTKMLFVCVVAELLATVNYTKILSVAQQCFYGKFMSMATMQIICNSFLMYLYSN
jgi:trimethylamine:corrinoid methyltransferase-like protein